jgi:transglutaminase-like putative cysteine protease
MYRLASRRFSNSLINVSLAVVVLLKGTRALNERIFHEFVYDQHFSDVETPVGLVLSEKRGVCQDFAHLMLACLRSKGIASRYVSGYLETDPPAGQPKLMGADASHAWVSVFVPGTGWIDFDPTNGLLPSDRHVTLAWGRDYADVVPLKGTNDRWRPTCPGSLSGCDASRINSSISF